VVVVVVGVWSVGGGCVGVWVVGVWVVGVWVGRGLAVWVVQVA
jgi:hypothetical protein